jgi:hypothetical protein
LEGLGLSEHKGVSEMLQERVWLRVCSIVQAEAKEISSEVKDEASTVRYCLAQILD